MKNTNIYSLPQFENEDAFNKEDFNDAFEKIDKALSDSQDVFDTLIINAGSSNAEVVIARGGEVNLDTRLDKVDTHSIIVDTHLGKIDSSLSEKANQIDLNTTNTVVGTKASIDYVNTKVDSVASGSPKDVFATLALLQDNTNVNTTEGKKNIYLVTTDGNWYYWNGSAWVSGGAYQSTGIADNSINETKLDPKLKNNIIIYNDLTNSDFSSNSIINYNDITNILTVPTISGSGYPLEHFALSHSIDNIEVITPPVGDADYKWVILAKNADGNYVYLSVVAPTPNASLFMKIGVCNATNRTYVTYNTVPTKYSSLPKLWIGVKLKVTHIGNYVYRMVTIDVEGNETLWVNFDLKDYYPNVTTGFTSPLANANLGICALDAEDKNVYLKSDIIVPLATKFDGVQEQINDVAVKQLPKWYSKKMNCFGDSITWGFTPITWVRMANPYPVIVGQLQGLNTVRNYGINATPITNNATNAMSVRYANMNDDADIISVFGGTNDFGVSPADLGTIADTTDATFYGALRVLITGLVNKYPTKTIFFITPLHRSDENVVNSKGHVLNDYVKAIREMCEMYSIPVLDLYKYSGLCPSIPIHFNTYILDGLHPTEVWHRDFLARKISDFMEIL